MPAIRDALGRHLTSPDQRGLNAYCIATALFVISLGARIAARGLLPSEGFPFLTFFPAVVLAAFLTSLGPALWCSFLSVLAARYFFISPRGSFFPLFAPDLVALVFFAAVITVDCIVISAMKNAMRSLKRAEERIKRSDRQKVDFMNVLAHEFRTPLQIISTTARMLKQKPGSDINQRADALERQARQMSRLVDDLLDSARADLNKLKINVEDLDLKQLLSNATASLTSILDDRRAITLHLPDHAILVKGDEARLTQVVENLVTNAAKFSPPSSEIEISVKVHNGLARVSVSDVGRGMTADQLSRMFEMYTQSSEDDAGKGGIGLGLSLAKYIVEIHGGTMMASSPGLGHGTIVEFSIPALNA